MQHLLFNAKLLDILVCAIVRTISNLTQGSKNI